MHSSFILQQYVCYTTILNMFRAVRCSSSGGQIILLQPLVSSPSLNTLQYAGAERTAIKNRSYIYIFPTATMVIRSVWILDHRLYNSSHAPYV